MKKLWRKYTEWNEKNRRKQFEWWSRKRRQGHPRWVVTIMLIFGGFMTINKILNGYYFRGEFDFWKLPFETIGCLIVGLIVGALTWRSNERKYQKFLKSDGDSKTQTSRFSGF